MSEGVGSGEQLDESALREWLATQPTLPRPRVAAVGLHLATNAGMLLRIADAVHAQEVLFVDAAYPKARKMRRASRMMSDTMPHQFISAVEFAELMPALAPCVAVEITANSQSVYASTLPTDVTFIVGSERHGIPQPILDQCAYAVHIPMFGQLSSMNVAVSAAVVLYEWVRQQLAQKQ